MSHVQRMMCRSTQSKEHVDGRIKSGHDGLGNPIQTIFSSSPDLIGRPSFAALGGDKMDAPVKPGQGGFVVASWIAASLRSSQ
ncbi:MAG: hypothetical protein Q7T44_07065 [Parvibaculum sp.]|nr:hypothetical protein [Parvibaculum sp.]